MTGEDLKELVKSSGFSISEIAKELGTSPQNFGAKLNRKSLKVDFIQKVTNILKIKAENSKSECECMTKYIKSEDEIKSYEVIAAENALLKKQIEFLQQLIRSFIAILNKQIE